MRGLVVVESPSKAETIKKVLGREWHSVATRGHFVESSKVSISDTGAWNAEWSVKSDRQYVTKAIKSAVSKGVPIIAATDPDREGEVIAHHVQQIAGKDIARVRIKSFTPNEIVNSFKSPSSVNTSAVTAGITRHILDKAIGVTASKRAWNSLRKSVDSSASPMEYTIGRVQGGALGLLRKHKMSVVGVRYREGFAAVAPYRVVMSGRKSHRVVNVKTAKKVIYPTTPLHTASMIAWSNATFGWNAYKTMNHANKLYYSGWITYPRTDSVRVSEYGYGVAYDFITNTFSPALWNPTEVAATDAGRSSFLSDAHECIRPATPVTKNVLTESDDLDYDDMRLYGLIASFFYGSQMPAVPTECAIIEVVDNGSVFEGLGFYKPSGPGYYLVFDYFDIEEPRYCGFIKTAAIPRALTVERYEGLNPLEDIDAAMNSACSDGELVLEMYLKYIGRPSTYSSTLRKLYSKKYIENIGGIASITDKGWQVLSWADDNMPFIVDPAFSGWMEAQMDKIENGYDIPEGTIKAVRKLLNGDTSVLTVANEPIGDEFDEFMDLSAVAWG